jgi:hypothetical protein
VLAGDDLTEGGEGLRELSGGGPDVAEVVPLGQSQHDRLRQVGDAAAQHWDGHLHGPR